MPLSSVSPGPAIAKIRVAAEPGATPIQIDSIGRFLAGRLDRHRGGGALGDDHDRGRGNFSATPVRFYFSLALSPPMSAYRSLPLRRWATPVPTLARCTTSSALRIVPAIGAVDVTPIARSAKVEDPATIVENALNLP
jgi:hypothetical protein